MTDRHETADYVLDKLRASGVDCGSVWVKDTVTTEIYYDSGKLNLIRTNFNASVSIKGLRSFKKGTVIINKTDEEALDEAVAQVLEGIESSPPDEAEGIADEVATKRFEDGPLVADKDAMYERMMELLDEAAKKYPSVSFMNVGVRHDREDVLYADTNGTVLESTSGRYSSEVVFMAVRGDKSSSFNYTNCTYKDISLPMLKLGETETEIALIEKQIDTRVLDGKFVGDVIMTPACFADLLGAVYGNFLSDSALIQGTSAYIDKLEKKVASEALTLTFEPSCKELASASPITDDGYIARDTTIIERGVLKTFALSRYGAAKTGGKRAGCAVPYLVAECGDRTLDELVGSVKRGILLRRFSGGQPASNGDLSGVAKNSFLIEDGRITDAVAETMVSGNLAEMLLNINGITKERVTSGGYLLPWVSIGGITVSGK